MYGYVIVNKPELKFKEYDRYRSYYCGLCDILREQYGIRGQVSLSYDMTFLVILLTRALRATDSVFRRTVHHTSCGKTSGTQK